ncbi:hypothetical protein E2C01_015049 [Portunus trituberculatus]|uniref:Uncharacterized protein n=1 Tax=Portunus trituberculatus TaxID=210409 RepID=A0A5B7DKB1_PORTR|nr:hypothetical protein [Portunus trituberculatus]
MKLVHFTSKKKIDGPPDDGDDDELIKDLFTGLATLAFFVADFVGGGVCKLDDAFSSVDVVTLGVASSLLGSGVAVSLGAVFSLAINGQFLGEAAISPLFCPVDLLEDFGALFLDVLVFFVFFDSFAFFFFFGDGIKSLPSEASDSASSSQPKPSKSSESLSAGQEFCQLRWRVKAALSQHNLLQQVVALDQSTLD